MQINRRLSRGFSPDARIIDRPTFVFTSGLSLFLENNLSRSFLVYGGSILLLLHVADPHLQELNAIDSHKFYINPYTGNHDWIILTSTIDLFTRVPFIWGECV